MQFNIIKNNLIMLFFWLKFKCYSISTISFIYFITFLGLIQNFGTIIDSQFDLLGKIEKNER